MDSIKLMPLLTAGVVGVFATASSSFRLDSYGIGSGGTSNSSSSNYRLNGVSGETSNTGATSTTYKANSGVNPTMQAHVPTAPVVTNPASYYNKLHIVINNGGNPSDATFAIAISTD